MKLACNFWTGVFGTVVVVAALETRTALLFEAFSVTPTFPSSGEQQIAADATVAVAKSTVQVKN